MFSDDDERVSLSFWERASRVLLFFAALVALRCSRLLGFSGTHPARLFGGHPSLEKRGEQVLCNELIPGMNAGAIQKPALLKEETTSAKYIRRGGLALYNILAY